jgi:hypothetical protein
MRVSILACLLLGLGAGRAFCAEDRAVVDSLEGRAAHSDLRTYYVNSRGGYPFRKAIDALGSRAPNLRTWGGNYLLAFFKQTVFDTRTGLSPRVEGMPPGGGTDVATQLRWQAAQELGRKTFAGKGTEALPSALWLYRDDPLRANAIHGMRALTHIDAIEVVQVIEEVLQGSHDSFEILAMAIDEVGHRKLEGHGETLRALAVHYHPEIRLSATQAAAATGVEELPPYDSAKPFPKRLTGRLAALAAMPYVRRAAAAPWRRLMVTYPAPEWQKGGKPAVRAHMGWYLGQEGDQQRLLSWEGTVRSFPADRVMIEKTQLVDSVREILDLRRQVTADRNGAVQQRLMEMLGRKSFAHTVGRWDPTLAEGLLSAWLVEDGQHALAAELLVPLLVQARHEGALFEYFRDGLAARLDQEMLRDFVAGRHATSRAVAEHLSQPRFAGWRHQPRARELATQLRGIDAADSAALTLPTIADWKKTAATLDRSAQIRQLADWIRLIRAEQQEIPGGVGLAQPQFAAPGAGPKGGLGARLINPLVELYNMDLRARELPLLFDTVRSPLYMRAYDLPRFQPHWPNRLYRARWGAVALIETVTQRDDLIDHALVESGTREAVDAHLAEVVQWCVEAGDTRLSDRLVEAIAEGDDWESAKGGMLMLEALDRSALVKAIAARITRGAEPLAELLPAAAHLGVREALAPARALLAEGTSPVRGWAALVLVRHGDREQREGIDQLLEVLRKGKDPLLLNNAVDALLATGDERARSALIDLLRPYAVGKPTMLLVQRLFLLGSPEAKAFLLDILDGKRTDAVYGHRIWTSGTYQPIADARTLALDLLEWAPSIRSALRAQSLASTGNEHKAVRAWIEEAFRHIKNGESWDIVELTVHPPYLGWSGAGRWIRRL